jgi:L-fuconolactonase
MSTTALPATTGRIDAHLHLWDLDAGDYAWLGPQHGTLFATFTADAAHAELARAGFDAAVLVQAEDTTRDTQFLLDTAARHPWVAGVVGWVPLDDPAATEAQLDFWRDSAVLRGVRHLVHNDPRDGFLALPTVRRSLALVAERGLAFDVPDAWPRHLDAVATLAAELPQLTVVVDHLGKPPRGGADYPAWRGALARVAARENTVAKVSGLRMPGQPYSGAALRPTWDTALALFGPNRLMYGGDWPMSVPDGGYQPTWQVLAELIGELSPSEQDALLAGSARTAYRLTKDRTIKRDRSVMSDG